MHLLGGVSVGGVLKGGRLSWLGGPPVVSVGLGGLICWFWEVGGLVGVLSGVLWVGIPVRCGDLFC